jgi:hypothetical protein
LYIEENEQVVQRVLAEHGDDWRLVAPKCLTTWSRRGMEIEGLTPEQAQTMIRVDPTTDETNGFFVACFERIPEDWNANTSKQSTTKAASLWKLDIPKGLQVYQGQFQNVEFPKTPPSSSKKRKAEQVEETPASSEPKSNKTSPKSPGATKKEDSSSSKKNQPNKNNQVDAKDTKLSKAQAAKANNKNKNDNDDPAKSATKRAKKQKWKEQQQKKRLDRLAKKQKTEDKTEVKTEA